MPQPVRIHYDGHATPTELPLFIDDSRSRNWWNALAHVNRYVAPQRPSFTLFDERCRIRYKNGVPNQRDLINLVSVLRTGFADKDRVSVAVS